MYTIFSNDIPIYLTDSLKNESELGFCRYQKGSINFVLNLVRSGEFEKVFLYHPDLKALWHDFKKHFCTNNYKYEKAAGGLIKNENDETLLIFRFGKWDLPKGKIEKGETKKEAALREVCEECGLKEVIIKKKLANTYHIFERNGKEILKKTHWYLMNTNHKGNLIPQIEEDITAVVFKNDKETKMAVKNSYESIKLLIQNLE